MDAANGVEVQDDGGLSADRLRNSPPDSVLDFGRRRTRNGDGGAVTFAARLDQPQDPEFAGGVGEGAAAVAPRDGGAGAGHLVLGLDHISGFQVAGQPGALGVDIGGDVMRHRAGVVADTDAAIEGGVAQPDWTAFLAVVENLPEADVMPMVGAAADRL